ncbi:hypothetical protein [Mycobacterium aquaticum]|uniref:Uncharacterized protein n=1 Tax=Mycobacterium aquaticum TaxID=1927124 RepID=A0A1X0AGV2_9MYCO|nr:hypothetical protein [Mycobacterium aquaticum]ORA29290.1 hypothetical protein BST13_27285 [Mycobacterium aquaticum]
MTTWTLTTSSPDAERVTMGSARDPRRARRDLVAAARTQMQHAPAAGTPRYVLHQDGVIVAIIQTGLTEAGTPDHAGAAGMLDRLDHSRKPFED